MSLITLMAYTYLKDKNITMKYLIYIEILYIFLLTLDTLSLYFRKNIMLPSKKWDLIIYEVSFLLGAAIIYFTICIVYSIMKKLITKKFSIIYILLAVVLEGIFISEPINKVISVTLSLCIIISILGYIFILTIVNSEKIKKEVRRLLYAYLILICMITIVIEITNIFNGLPYIFYKIPYVPCAYFLINIIAVYYLKKFFKIEKKGQGEAIKEFEKNDMMNHEFLKKYGVTERELEIIDLIVEGKSNNDIGKQLFISVNTVRNHIYNIYKKVGIKNRYELINKVTKSMENNSSTKS